MFLIDPILAHFNLTWSEQQHIARPLPTHIRRTHVQSPGGPLELLICDPKPDNNTTGTVPPISPPIFFLHGGYGHASIWLEWLTYLHNQNYPSPMYAFSARAHGTSYSLPYTTQVHKTTFEDILSDATYCLNHVTQLHKQSPTFSSRPPILVGHSSGGGLAQALLSSTHTSPDKSITLSTRASGLCLVDSIPHFGSLDIYWNWLRHDPYFPVRSLFHLSHPTSPLSTLSLVHGAFFSKKCPRSTVEEFWRWAPAYESMEWPKAMLGLNFGEWWRGKPGVWLDVEKVVAGIDGVEGDGNGARDKICVMVGREDMMYRPEMWERMCREFREVIGKLRGKMKVVDDVGAVEDRTKEEDEPIEKVTVERTGGVRLVLVDESGHHVQNDVYCEQAAEALLRWVKQV